MKRVFLIVLDSFGIGEEPDAALYGDEGSNTMYSCSKDENFDTPNMEKMGLFAIDGVTVADDKKHITADQVVGAYARLREASAGKDTTTGHWEMAGCISKKPMPTFPDGFPQSFIDAFSERVGRKCLCNKPYSGTKVIEDYGKEQLETGALIVYTSADSVFQIAAHEDIIPVEKLYEYCQIARDMLTGDLGCGRVIARPYIGEPGHFTRTGRRHDFSLQPTSTTMLDVMKDKGLDVIGVGKIVDIFAGRGVTEFVRTPGGNPEGIDKTIEYFDKDFNGLCFVNLVDGDMLYGHRRDVPNYAKAMTYFDEHLPQMIEKMRDDDIIMITADHGCDPAYIKHTDHTREYVPLLMYGKNIPAGKNFGTTDTFADIAATIIKYFDVEGDIAGKSLL